MTRDQATSDSATLNAEHPQRDEFFWGVRQDRGGEWSVVRVRRPTTADRGPLTPSQQGKQATPPNEHPLDLPGGLSPWGVGF
jgi:hypothetical protein